MRVCFKDKERNKSFKKVVIDRRGKHFKKIVCFSNDVVLTMDIDTYEKDFHFIERRSEGWGFGEGDRLYSSCVFWPDVDRGGEYKADIDELNGDLIYIMDMVRDLLF